MNKRAKAAFSMAPNRGTYLSIKVLQLRQVDIKSHGRSIKIIECNSYIELRIIVKGFAEFTTSLTNLLDTLGISSDNSEISENRCYLKDKMAVHFFAIKILVAVLYGLLGIFQLSTAGAQAPSSGELEAAIFVDRAVLAYSEKRYDAALKELQEALRLHPQSVDALYYQGLVYSALDRPGDARASLEKARAIQPADADVAFQLGVLHFAQKEYEQAEPLLRQAYQADPRRPNIGYYLGFIEYRKKNYRDALTLLRANVPSDDNFAQLARFYTGLAVAALGFAGEARAEIDQALRLQPVSPLVVPLQRFGEILQKAEKEEKFFRGELRLGVYYDTNVPVVPGPNAEQTVKTIRDDQRRRKSEGELANVNLGYTWLKTPDWTGDVSYRFLQTYNNRLTEFNAQSHTPSFTVGNRGSMPSAFGDLPYDAGLQLAYDFISLGNAAFSQRGIVSPYVTLESNRGKITIADQSFDFAFFTTLQYRFQLKDFDNDKEVVRREVRDAKNYMVGPVHLFLLDEGRHYLRLGYQYDAEFAEGENWSYRGHRLLAGFQFTIPEIDVRFRYDLDYHWRFHRNKHSLQPTTALNTIRRRDREPVHQIGIAKDFVPDFLKSSFFCGANGSCSLGVALEYLYDRTNSNLAVFQYNRHVVTTSVAWRF
jgi:tetratricopeptide (TPR) repeat protein